MHPQGRIRAARAEPALALPGGGLAQRGTGTGGETRASEGTAVLLAGFSCRIKVFLSLSPHPPSPPGKGESKVISCKGLRPLHPRAETQAARAEPALASPGGGLAQRGTGTGGEAHVQGAESGRRGLNLRWRCPAGACPAGHRNRERSPRQRGLARVDAGWGRCSDIRRHTGFSNPGRSG